MERIGEEMEIGEGLYMPDTSATSFDMSSFALTERFLQ